MFKFKIGHTVKVVNEGRSYSTYNEWATLNKLPNFVSGAMLENGDTGVVVDVAPHGYGGDILYAVEHNSQQYIIGEGGLELVTVQPPVFKVGDKIKVIDTSGNDMYKQGEIVTVMFVDIGNSLYGDMIYVEEYTGGMYASRFELAESEPTIYFKCQYGKGGEYRLEWNNGAYQCLLPDEVYKATEKYAEYTVEYAQQFFNIGSWVKTEGTRQKLVIAVRAAQIVYDTAKDSLRASNVALATFDAKAEKLKCLQEELVAAAGLQKSFTEQFEKAKAAVEAFNAAQ